MLEVKTSELLVLSCVLLLHVSCVKAAVNCSTPGLETLFNEFERELFPKKLLRPVNYSSSVNITISITVVGVLGLDEKSQTMTTFLWQILEWDIEWLSWDEKECGASRVSIPRENVWSPDVHIMEFMDEDQSPEAPYIYLYNTGHVFDDKPVRAVTSCQLVIYTFPFDIQNCTITFGPYLHFESDIRMIQGHSAHQIIEESKNVSQSNGEWELIDIKVDTATISVTEGTYSEIRYYVALRRRPMLYVVNLLIPSCFLITVDLFSFLLPPQSVDRSSFKMTLILGYTVFLLIMNDLLPVTGGAIPLINVFFSISLALMVASLMETIFITNIQHSTTHSEVPPWLSIVVLRYLAILVFLPPKVESNRVTVVLSPQKSEQVNTGPVSQLQGMSNLLEVKTPLDPQQPMLDELKKLSKDLIAIRLRVDHHFAGSAESEEWQMIGIVIDRLLFGIYILFIFSSFGAIIFIWIWSNIVIP